MGPEIDLRMTVQQGAFTIHGTETPFEERAAEKYLTKFVIPEEARDPIADELWGLGIRGSGLFPDLGGLAQDLRDDYRLIP